MDYCPSGSSVHRISQAKYWSGLSFPSPGDLPDPGVEPASPTLAGDGAESLLAGRFLPLSLQGSPHYTIDKDNLRSEK